MKKMGLALFALVLLTTLSVKCDKVEGCEKIIITHNDMPLEISPNAYDAHIAHGDPEGVICVPRK